ncbi:MAG: bifunctional serine/threonine-protein kinase/formylglycine-generating enzyme family protein [Deltaproteobacteria bacterium]
MSKGAAILAVGHGLSDSTSPLTSLVAQIGETLLSNEGWRVRRLSPLAGERDGADRASWKRCLSELCDDTVDTIVLALAGAVTMHDDEPCLVTGPDAARYPEEHALPLAWITEKLRNCTADRVVVVASLEGPQGDTGWLDALATNRARHVIATERSEGRALALHALLAGTRGGAIDPRTGTITLRSLGDYLGKTVKHVRLQVSNESATLASSPPLAGPWDARLTSRPGVPRSTEQEEVLGTVLPGRFKIERELARGAFGNVYLARQLSVDRDVAVKVLHGAVAPGSETGRLFVQEIQSVGRLDHPNIVRIFQADITAQGSLFYAMELLAGRDLQQIVDEGVVEKSRALALARQLATALGAAHDVGLVHADVKPANAVVVPPKKEEDTERLVLLDFGLARLRSETTSAGGTPAYMAPEQLRDARVDARSDVFSAALVLVTLLTGWRRRGADQLVPPLDAITDAKLRGVLAKALALAPGDRYQHGGELAAALGASASVSATTTLAGALASSPPFRHLAPFTETDRDRLYGRDREIATLVEHVLFRRAVVYTAPSGTGKTSLLRAGLVTRLASLGVSCVYVACHGREPPDLARAIWPEGTTAVAAAAARIAKEGKRLVVVVDQVEAPLASAGFAAALRELERATASIDEGRALGVVFSVREDVLASLLAQLHDQTNVLRLGPLSPDAAREAIVGPLIERRVMIEEPLLAALLADLQRAASLLAAEMRWSAPQAVYPPHLQLACSSLFDQLEPGEELLTLRHYEQLGGLDEIVRDYLDRVLETELPGEQVAIARRILLALIDSDRARAVRTDAELAVLAGEDIAPVIEALRLRGVIVPLRAHNGEPAWELVHDSLVPRVLAWTDRQDLARQRALEIVRHHLRGSDDRRPSLLNAAELREVRPFKAAIDELDRDWTARGASKWTPVRLVALSRRTRRDRWIALALSVITALCIAGFLGLRWFREREERLNEELLSKADLGVFTLELHAFDWNALTLEPKQVPTSKLPLLRWRLLEPSAEDELSPSTSDIPLDRTELPSGGERVWRVETRGGKAILQVEGRGQNGERCAPSNVPLARLPGYAGRERAIRIVVIIPTCAATHSGTVAIPGGAYRSGGKGNPPVEIGRTLDASDIAVEQDVRLETFEMDRTEVSNAAYRTFAAPQNATLVAPPAYPVTKGFPANAGNNDYPVTDITWQQARAFCRFMGKELPSDHEWERALRGGLTIAGAPNPNPIRTLPWGTADTSFANLRETGEEGRRFEGGERTAAIGESTRDVSVEGILNLAGNVQEWTRTPMGAGFYSTRGCSWNICTRATLVNTLAVSNMRLSTFKFFELGVRCVVEGPHPNSD